MHRVFMIGWDGATFDLIHPWVEQGKLPHIAELLRAGVHGSLRSTVPPWTFPAWNSFMTGKNPGKHGIFDFFRPRPGSYDLEFVNGGHRRAPTFWQILSQAGRHVISISVPCTFPPEPVNGIMISGFDFPGEGPGSYVDARGTYPPALHDELARTVGRHPIDAPIIKEVNRGRFDLVLERMIETVRQKAATAKYLMTRHPWDCFMILFGESDGGGHQFWKYCDPKSPLYVPDSGLHDSILRIYQELDRQAGELLALLPADATILMMSDHGFGGVSDWVIYPNRWLQDAGFLRLHGTGGNWQSRFLEGVKHRAVAGLPAWAQRAIYRGLGLGLGRFEARVRYGMIDWPATEAYFDENPYFPVLRVNLKGRQPGGTVEPGKHYEEVRDRAIRALEDWRHPKTGGRIVEQAFRREEIYSGPCLDQAPDVIPKWALHQGYNYAFRLSSKAPAATWIEQIDPRQREQQQFFTAKSGSHRDHGIFLAKGPAIRAGAAVAGARIIDLAPTILHLLDVPIPDDMDGRVLEEIYAPASADLPSVQWTAGRGESGDGTSDGYTAEDEAAISERLKSLGYVE